MEEQCFTRKEAGNCTKEQRNNDERWLRGWRMMNLLPIRCTTQAKKRRWQILVLLVSCNTSNGIYSCESWHQWFWTHRSSRLPCIPQQPQGFCCSDQRTLHGCWIYGWATLFLFFLNFHLFISSLFCSCRSTTFALTPPTVPSRVMLPRKITRPLLLKEGKFMYLLSTCALQRKLNETLLTNFNL